MLRSVPGPTPRIHPDTWIDPTAQAAAGSLVPPGKVVEAGCLVMGARDYVDLWRDYAEGDPGR